MERLSLDTRTLAPKNGLPSVEWYDLDRVMKEGVFDWDKVVKSTHPWNCWYGLPCTFNVFVKDGVALREEQPHNYWEPNREDLPDLNGKGCQKGCGQVHRLYEAQRLLHPLKRVGERGGGKWKRVSWDEALDDIAGKMFKSMVEDGMHSVGSLGGTSFSIPLYQAWGKYFGFPETGVEPGDHHPGFYEATGKNFTGDSADFFSDCHMVIIWGGNPSYTWMPLFHYLVEARYHGAKLVCVNADYSASSLPCDLWIPVKAGSDAALALGMMHVIVEEGLEDRAFIVEQTDLPLLVRKDNGKLLREKDIKKDGRDYVLHMWDERSNKLREAPVGNLGLGDIKPALEGEWEIKTLKGKVKVTTVYSLFTKKLMADYRPEQVSAACGVAPDLIRQFAREFAKAHVVSAVSQSNFGKYYHGNIMERACVLLFALTGHAGRRGNWPGLTCSTHPDAPYGTIQPLSFRDTAAQLVNHPDYHRWKEQGRSPMREATCQAARTGTVFPIALTMFFHGGYTDLHSKYNNWDPNLKRPLSEYLEEGLKGGTIRKPVMPAPGRPLRVLVNWGGNVVRRARANQFVTNVLYPKVDLIVTPDYRWTASCMYSDYVLPVPSSAYESGAGPMGAWTAGPGPTMSYPGRAVDFPGESKSDWWILSHLFQRIAKLARENGIKTVKAHEFGVDKQIDNMDEYITSSGLYPADDGDWSMMMDTVANAYNVESNDVEEFERKGWCRLTHPGEFPTSGELGSDFVPGEPIIGNIHHTEKKLPWPTYTGRIQFYIDHDWYQELGEEFPWHKDALKAGGDYPIQVLGGHTRWSIHSQHADSPLQQMLQRGEPLMFMNDRDAASRGIADGDKVEIFNDVGRSELQVAVTGRVRPGTAFIYHHWDNSQFKGWRAWQQTMPTPFNPIAFAPAGDDYPNLRMNFVVGYPGMVDRDTRVEIRKVD